jgi:hypothetical protein
MVRIYGAIAFWLLVIFPLAGLFVVHKAYGGNAFVYGLIIYAIVYRPILNIIRLLGLKKITRKDIWKFFIPFYEVKYTKSLWCG